MVDKLYEFRDGRVTEHLGSVQEFLEKRKLETLQELERRAVPETSAPKPTEKTENARKFQEQKTQSRELRKLQNRVSYLEKEIAAHEARMAAIEKVLACPGKEDDVMDLTREYLEHKRDLDCQTEEWTQLMEQMELA